MSLSKPTGRVVPEMTKAEVQALISKLKLIAVPTIGSIKSAYKKIETLPENTGLIFNKIVLTKINGEVNEIDISFIENKDFIDGLDLQKATDGASVNISNHSLTNQYGRFSFEPIPQGKVKEFEYNGSGLKVLSVTNRTNDAKYCDLVAWVVDNRTGEIMYQLTYNQKKFNTCATHSGDDKDGSFLLQFMEFKKGDEILNYTVIIGYVGFMKNKLKTYINHRPMLVYPNEDTNTCIVCPVSLAPIEVGESTLVILNVVKFYPDNYKIFNIHPIYLRDEDTNTLSKQVKVAINEAIIKAGEILDSSKSQPKISISVSVAPILPQIETESDTAWHRFFDKKFSAVIFSSTGHHKSGLFSPKFLTPDKLMCIVSDGRLKFYNDCGDFKSQQISPLKGLTPPLYTGYISGSIAGLVKRPLLDDEPVNMPPDLFRKCNMFPIIIITPENSPDSFISCGEFKVNGLYILNKYVETDTELSEGQIMKIMQEINRSGFMTCGPNAICLVMINSKLYWYQGAFIENLLPYYPRFGENVSDIFTEERLDEFMKSGEYGKQCSLPPFMSKGSTEIQVFGKVFENPYEAIKSFGKIPFKFLVENKDKFLGFLNACSNLLDPDALKIFSLKIIETLNALMDTDLTKEKDSIRMKLSNLDLSPEDRKVLLEKYGRIVRKIKENKMLIQPLIDAAGNMWCQNTVSKSMEHINAKQILREASIKGKIEKFKAMTIADISEWFENISRCLCISINPDSFVEYLKLIPLPKDDFNLKINSGHKTLELIKLLRAMEQQLDGVSVSSLMLICNGEPNILTVPNSITCSFVNRSDRFPVLAVPFPPDKLLSERNPKKLRWEELAISDEIISLFRFLLRKCFCDAEITRKLGISIMATSETLTFAIIHMLLSIAEEIISTLPATKTSCEFEDGLAETIRAIIIHIMTICGSGTNPACCLFTLFYAKILVLPENQTWIALRLFNILPFTGWDIKIINKTITKYLLQIIKEKVIYPMVKPIHDMKDIIAKKAASKSCDERDEDLYQSHALCEAMLLLAFNPDMCYDANNIAQRALSFSDSSPSKDSGVYNVYIFLRYVIKNFPEKSWEEITSAKTPMIKGKPGINYFQDALDCAVNIYIRRSTILKKPKISLCNAIRKYYENKEFEKSVPEYNIDSQMHIILSSLAAIKEIIDKFRTISSSFKYINKKDLAKLLELGPLLTVSEETGKFPDEAVKFMKEFLGVNKTDKAEFILSDGEVNNNCFTTKCGDGFEKHNKEMEKNAEFIRGANAFSSALTTKSTTLSVEKVEVVIPLIETLSVCSSPALDLAKCITNTSETYDIEGFIGLLVCHGKVNSVLKNFIETLIKQTEMTVETLNKYIQILLMNWKNLEDGLHACMQELEKQ